jgi:hypothetical protein
VKEEAERHAIRIALHDIGTSEAAARLLRVDSAMFARARGLASQLTSDYTTGGRLHPPERLSPLELIALEARFHTLLPFAAAAVPAAVRRTLAPTDLLAILARTHTDTLAAQLWIA